MISDMPWWYSSLINVLDCFGSVSCVFFYYWYVSYCFMVFQYPTVCWSETFHFCCWNYHFSPPVFVKFHRASVKSPCCLVKSSFLAATWNSTVKYSQIYIYYMVEHAQISKNVVEILVIYSSLPIDFLHYRRSSRRPRRPCSGCAQLTCLWCRTDARDPWRSPL